MKELIDEFVESLFTNGAGSKAERLLLWRDTDKANLGGWSRAAIRDRIADFLALREKKLKAEIADELEKIFRPSAMPLALRGYIERLRGESE